MFDGKRLRWLRRANCRATRLFCSFALGVTSWRGWNSGSASMAFHILICNVFPVPWVFRNYQGRGWREKRNLYRRTFSFRISGSSMITRRRFQQKDAEARYLAKAPPLGTSSIQLRSFCRTWCDVGVAVGGIFGASLFNREFLQKENTRIGAWVFVPSSSHFHKVVLQFPGVLTCIVSAFVGSTRSAIAATLIVSGESTRGLKN